MGPIDAVQSLSEEPPMKRLLAACLISTIYCSIGSAQQPLISNIDRPVTVQTYVPTSVSAPPATPEMWIYAQEQRRHDDPAQAVRRKAEFQAEQRMARIASLKWYGYSNSRPEASCTPVMGSYSAGWVGNGWNRYDWVGGGMAGGYWLR
jgi:hypothetical protein